MTVTDRRFPLCSKLGVLRAVNLKNGHGVLLTISPRALHDKLGWAKYQKFLPYMRYQGATIDPDSCEAFLRAKGA